MNYFLGTVAAAEAVNVIVTYVGLVGRQALGQYIGSRRKNSGL